MSARKAGVKSGWKARDKAYRKDVAKRRRSKLEKKAAGRLFDFLAGFGGPFQNRAERRASIQETEAILADPDTMAAIAEAEADLEAGNVVEVAS